MLTADRLGIGKGITAVTGSGGKTTLIALLARELAVKGTVIVTTSTKIYEPAGMTLLCEDDGPCPAGVAAGLERTRTICVGRHIVMSDGEVKLGPPATPFAELAGLADYVLVEADGSKHLPMKAHLDSEPVIPEGTRLTVRVAGIHGIGKTIEEAAHRPELFARLAGADTGDVITPALAARVINSEGNCDVVYLAGISSPGDTAAAEELAGMLTCPAVMQDTSTA